ncbi:MAG: hypothetical protein JNK81_13015 [Anaerolineales bacterium]|nr:hypothetical protein [Anaerolineales bacterium]
MPSSIVALGLIPNGLRDPLLEEYRLIAQNFMERKWLPSELSGGRFCEIVYTILDGYAKSAYESSPIKPNNFVQACRNLENNTNVPRSFQILIPRFLPALYEIRNNRGVGHVGGDVDPNFMDSTAVFATVNWIMAELVRVFHQMTTDEAQKVVNQFAERRIPLVWQIGDVKRVLDPSISLKDQILLLIFSSSSATLYNDLLNWTEYKDKKYFKRLLKDLHKKRFIELSADETSALILPPGASYVEEKLLPTLI